jgi:nitroimidazol reductase NimA-like FMN-containing flavoprotein (pyridoxamine 5'-phosphate oxidase superfamily)
MKHRRAQFADEKGSRVVFRDLAPHEVEEMLNRHNVGRMAYSFHDRVDIEPIHFVYADGAMYGRTASGSKLTTLLHHPWVALEIDEVDGLFDWRSVVVKGTVYVVEQGLSSDVAEHYERAVEAIRTLVPDAFTEDDPVPARSIVFRIHIHEKRGRAAGPAS